MPQSLASLCSPLSPSRSSRSPPSTPSSSSPQSSDTSASFDYSYGNTIAITITPADTDIAINMSQIGNNAGQKLLQEISTVSLASSSTSSSSHGTGTSSGMSSSSAGNASSSSTISPGFLSQVITGAMNEVLLNTKKN